MDSSTKILVGAVVTGMLAIGVHSLGAVGSSFVDGLEENAISQITESGLKGVTVSFEREPSVKRDAILSGDVSEADREKAIALVKDINGIGNVRWAEDDADGAEGDGEGTGNSPVNAEATAQCQDNVNEIMDGKNISFRSGSAYVSPDSFALLDEITTTLKPCSDIRLEVQGHTDLTGKAEVNQRLSEARAESVKKSLVERGLDADIIAAKGYGSTQPLENARTSAANLKNRRTVFVIGSSQD